jgi:6-phosphofructokinase 1
MIPSDVDLTIPTLGVADKPSPLDLSTIADDQIADFTPDGARIRCNPSADSSEGPSFELAGPRQRVLFSGSEVAAGIVTCGGLCPGMNNVVRQLVLTLWHQYGVRRILGFRYGFRGLGPETPDPPLDLSPEVVRDYHMHGGTILGSSRGPQTAETMVDTLQRLGLDLLFVIGGDGGMRGTRAIYEEVCRRELRIAVIGVPKTIDNDLPYIERTFGYETAVSVATEAIHAAHVEAMGAPNGIGLIRLMGRHSGFIAAAATLAAREANLVLVPEQPFAIDGERGILTWLRERLAQRGHAVIVVAEGAGQNHLQAELGHDPSGNVKLGDIGQFLKKKIGDALRGQEFSLKYIDPSYMIRAKAANPADAIFCGRLAEDAVHAAMAGKTGMVVGLWLNRFTHVPLHAATSRRKTISLDSAFWRSVVNTTGQPALLS